MSVRADGRVGLQRRPVSWDDGLGLLGDFLGAPSARAILSLSGNEALRTGWGRLSRIDAEGDHVCFECSGVSVSLNAADSDLVVAESWEHGLSQALMVGAGTAELYVEASWWEHPDPFA